MRRTKAFTLVELLIVVAIIAILAAIAVPNFLEAQVRAKVSRARTDMRSVATGLEAYQVDYNRYPPNFISPPSGGYIYAFLYAPYQLTSPISYVSENALLDIFRLNSKPSGNTEEMRIARSENPMFDKRFAYQNSRFWTDLRNEGWRDGETGQRWLARTEQEQGGWYLASYGPDLKWGPEPPSRTGANRLVLYDPTNGTISKGDIVRSAKDTTGKGVD